MLTTIDNDLPCRIEWAEGVEPRWDFWIFEESADVQIDDVLIQANSGLAVIVERASLWADLRGKFHHYEVVGQVHELPAADLLL